MSLARYWRRWCTAIVIGIVAMAPSPAQAQTAPPTPPPPTQDSQLRRLLALGLAAGCLELLFPNQDNSNRSGQDVLNELDRLAQEGTPIGNELRAICSPSAVASASSLGGALGTLQATKTVTQPALAQKRIDRRLRLAPRKPRRDGRSPFMPAWEVAGSASAFTFGDDMPSGVGVFGAVQFNKIDRTDTPFESGFDADVTSFTAGIDYLSGRSVVGGWFGTATQSASFTRFSALLSGPGEFPDVLQNPVVLRSVCGGLDDAGSFEQTSRRLGGFVGWLVGTSGFMDVSFDWARHEHEYLRSVCAIETPGAVTFENGVLRQGDNVVDDIFAGRLSGIHTIHEISGAFRVGADFGNDVVRAGPRVFVTLARATTDAFAETGASTVANPVRPVFRDDEPILRQLGGPIGLELAFEEQARTSFLIQAGGEVSVRAGAVSPFAAFYYRRELMDDFPVVSARFVQDGRANPTVFDFGLDAYDSNAFLFSFGVMAAAEGRVAARFEIAQLHRDSLFGSRTITAQAIVRF